MNDGTCSWREIAVLGVPSSAGARRRGQEEGPDALRALGLIDGLLEHGFAVLDSGDLPILVGGADPGDPKQQNLGLVAGVVRDIANEVSLASRNRRFLLVLGGDCTITIGVVAGLLGNGSRLGLAYFDGDLDLNTPATTPSGIFDGMVTAHLLGQGAPELARPTSRGPLLEESHLVYFGYNLGAGGIDPPEFKALARSAALRYPIELVREDPVAAAREALSTLEDRVDRILLHFDIDITDTLAVDVPHANGLSLDDTVCALKIFLASPKCIGLVVTELNPALDPDGAFAGRLADQLVGAINAARHPPHAEGSRSVTAVR